MNKDSSLIKIELNKDIMTNMFFTEFVKSNHHDTFNLVQTLDLNPGKYVRLSITR